MLKPPANANKGNAVRPEVLLLSAVRALWKQKYAAMAVAVVVTAAIAAGVQYLPSIYQAESLIMVDSQKIPEKFVASTVQLSLQDSLDTIRQQILSATRLQQLMDEFGLYADERKTRTPEELTDKMRAEIATPMEKGWGTGRSGAFRVIYEGPDPKVVAAVVNRIAALFIEENLKTRELRAEGTFDFIESQLKEARTSLEAQERALSDYKVSKLGELPQQEGTLTGTLTRLHSDLQAHQTAIDQAEQNKLVLENALRTAESAEAALRKSLAVSTADATRSSQPLAVTPTPVAAAPPVIRESQRIAGELDALRLRYREEHPDVQRLLEQLRAAQERERREPPPPAAAVIGIAAAANPAPAVSGTASSLVTADIARERDRIAGLRTQIDILVRQNQSRERDKQVIKRQIDELQARLERLPVREQELASLTRDYETSRENYRSLLDKRTSAEMAAEMEKRQQAERFRILDRAHVPVKPIRPNRPLLYAAGAVAGLIVGVLVAGAIELRKNVVLGEWELPPNVVILGRVSHIPAATASRKRRRKEGAAA